MQNRATLDGMTYRAEAPIQPLVYLASSVAVALNRESGREIWRYKGSARIMRVVYTLERILLLDADCVLHCLRPHDGMLLDKVQVDERSQWGTAMLSGANGELFIATSRSVIALDPSGHERWRFTNEELPSSAGSGLAGLASPDGVVQPDLKE